MTDIQIKDICWNWFEDDEDNVQIKDGPSGWRVSGRQGMTCYWLCTNAAGETTWLRVTIGGPKGTAKTVALRREDTGWRHKTGDMIPNSANAVDPDIACTALTNTLPIRRLNLAVDDSAEIDVLYIPLPTLEPQVVQQRYTRQPDGYLYENLTSGFSALLTVDSDGWVTDYPGVCRMIGPPQ